MNIEQSTSQNLVHITTSIRNEDYLGGQGDDSAKYLSMHQYTRRFHWKHPQDATTHTTKIPQGIAQR
jgi:hypothetical protein